MEYIFIFLIKIKIFIDSQAKIQINLKSFYLKPFHKTKYRSKKAYIIIITNSPNFFYKDIISIFIKIEFLEGY